MSTEHAAARPSIGHRRSRTQAARAIGSAVAGALLVLALFSGEARGAAPEPPPEVGPDKPYLEFYNPKRAKHSFSLVLPIDYYFRKDIEFSAAIGIGVVWRYYLKGRE